MGRNVGRMQLVTCNARMWEGIWENSGMKSGKGRATLVIVI